MLVTNAQFFGMRSNGEHECTLILLRFVPAKN